MGDYFHMVSDDLGANLAYAATFNGEQDVYFARIGEPGLPRRGSTSRLDRSKYACDGQVDIRRARLWAEHRRRAGRDGGPSRSTSTPTRRPVSRTVTLNETGIRRRHAVRRIDRAGSMTDGCDGGLLHVTEGDTITVTYLDADDGEPAERAT